MELTIPACDGEYNMNAFAHLQASSHAVPRESRSAVAVPGRSWLRGLTWVVEGGHRKWVVVLLLFVHIFFLGWEAYGDSAGWDEIGHFAAGVDQWRHNRFKLYCVNPPLVRLVALSPIMLFDHTLDTDLDRYPLEAGLRPEFHVGTSLALRLGSSRYFQLLTVARWMCIPFSLVGAWTCYRWSGELFGTGASLVALTLWAFSPSVLAYGHLITSDMAASGLGIAAAYAFRRWLNGPTTSRAVVAGIALGLAQLTKMTLVVFMFLWPILWIAFQLLGTKRCQATNWKKQFWQITGILSVALWVLNFGYGFEGSMKFLKDYRFVSSSLAGPQRVAPIGLGMEWGNRFANSWVGRVPVPLPENYLRGIDLQRLDFEHKSPSYLRGEWRIGGWWYYYLYAMLIKEPLATWVLLAISILLAVGNPRLYAAGLREELLLIIPAAVLLIFVSSQTGFNHHLRYALPSFPFIFVLISRVSRAFVVGHRAIASVVCLAMTYSVISSLIVVPHSLSYFNELAGGPRGGHWQLANSNADWGQDLLYLKRWYDTHPDARPLHIKYDLALIDPTFAGIPWRPIAIGNSATKAISVAPADRGPRPGWYVVSVNQLHEMNHNYEYFNELTPVDWIGYTLPVYHVTLDEANELRRKADLPVLSGSDDNSSPVDRNGARP
jgi:Dolichyl-phosphate-mannose-protein mannosyltransferase